MDRRTALRLGVLTGAGAVAAACTPSSSPKPSTSASSPKSSTPTNTVPRNIAGPPPPPKVNQTHRSRYARLKSQLSGTLALPGAAAYRPDQLLYNPRFANQAKPQAIAYVHNSKDVADCVRFAAAGNATLRVRNGGHSYGGWSSGTGLVVDLRYLRFVRVNGDGTATVGAGALLADVYQALAAKGVSIGAGSCATVGVSGLTLGGGIGLLTREYGLTCDQVVAIQVVTADGRIRTVDKHREPDLFWALRGGGGSFGAVTAFKFAVRPAPQVSTTILSWPSSAAGEVLTAWQNWTRHTPGS